MRRLELRVRLGYKYIYVHAAKYVYFDGSVKGRRLAKIFEVQRGALAETFLFSELVI